MALLMHFGVRVEEAAVTRPASPCQCERLGQCRSGRRPNHLQFWRPGRWRFAGGILLAVMLIAPNVRDATAQGQTFKEYEVKAAFLYNFAQFVDWPPEAFPSPEAPLVIGVLGVDPFGSTLDQLVHNEVVRTRKLSVQRYRRVEDIGLCHILYVSPSEGPRLAQILARVKGKPILTVGDSEGFAQGGGMIRFLTERNKIRLKINVEAAKAANLIISSKLLRASELVRNDEPGRRF